MQDSIEQYMQTVGKQARQAASVLAGATTLAKNNALSAIYTAWKIVNRKSWPPTKLT